MGDDPQAVAKQTLPSPCMLMYRSDAWIRKALNKGTVVVRSTRTGSGVVPPDASQPGLVSDSLNPAKSRILLMLVLSKTHNADVIQDYFHTY